MQMHIFACLFFVMFGYVCVHSVHVLCLLVVSVLCVYPTQATLYLSERKKEREIETEGKSPRERKRSER